MKRNGKKTTVHQSPANATMWTATEMLPRTPHIIFFLLTVFRVLVVAGVLIRLYTHWAQASQAPFWIANKYLVVTLTALYSMLVIRGLWWYLSKGKALLHHREPLADEEPSRTPARRFLWFIITADCVFITLMYAITMTPESDFYLFFFVPLMTGLLFLPSKDALRLLALVVSALVCALLLILSRWDYHVKEVIADWTLQRIVINVLILRALALACACLPLGLLLESNRSLKVSETKLKASTQLYESLFKTIPDYIFRKDRDKKFQFASESFCKFLGKHPSKVVGADDYAFFPKALADRFRDDDDLILNGDEALLRKEEQNVLLNSNKERTVLVTKVPILDSDGIIIGVQASFIDVTEQKREQHKMLRWFVHDTPKPLVIIRDKHLHALRAAIEGLPNGETLTSAQKACERIATIIEFGLACFDAYGFLGDSEQYRWKWDETDGSDFNLHEVVDVVLVSVRPNEDAVKFRKDIPENSKIRSDKYKIIAVIFLLVDNAIKAVKKRVPQSANHRMEVQIGLKISDEGLLIYVQDNGCGMSEATKQSASKEGYSEFNSTGLGLVIVSGFAKLAGGAVTFNSAVDRGTTVELLINNYKRLN